VPPDTGFHIPPIIIPPIPPFVIPYIYPLKTYTWVIDSPIVGGIPGPRISSLQTAVRLDYFVVGEGEGDPYLSFNIESRLVNTAPGTDLLTSDVTALVGAVGNLSIANPTLAVGYWLWLDISVVHDNVSKFVVTVTTQV